MRKGLELQVNQNLRLDFSLQVGSVNQEVLVTAEAPVLDTESHAVGQVVQSKQIVGLPLLGRNAYSLGALVPGVRTARGMNDVPVDIISTASSRSTVRREMRTNSCWTGRPIRLPHRISRSFIRTPIRFRSSRWTRAALVLSMAGLPAASST